MRPAADRALRVDSSESSEALRPTRARRATTARDPLGQLNAQQDRADALADIPRLHITMRMGVTGIPPIDGVVETILYVDDLARAVAFYRDVLGLRAMTGDGSRFQAFDSGAKRVLLLFTRGGTLEPVPAPVGMIPPHDGSGPLHIGLAIPADAYVPWRERLKSLGIAIESETCWERGGRSLYFRDPDNHLVELITPGIWEVY